MPNPGPGVDTDRIYGQTSFPHPISDPFRHGRFIAFSASILMLLTAAGASLLCGSRYVHDEAHGETLVQATAREGDALVVPAVLGEDVAYDGALRGS